MNTDESSQRLEGNQLQSISILELRKKALYKRFKTHHLLLKVFYKNIINYATAQKNHLIILTKMTLPTNSNIHAAWSSFLRCYIFIAFISLQTFLK